MGDAHLAITRPHCALAACVRTSVCRHACAERPSSATGQAASVGDFRPRARRDSSVGASRAHLRRNSIDSVLFSTAAGSAMNADDAAASRLQRRRVKCVHLPGSDSGASRSFAKCYLPMKDLVNRRGVISVSSAANLYQCPTMPQPIAHFAGEINFSRYATSIGQIDMLHRPSI